MRWFYGMFLSLTAGAVMALLAVQPQFVLGASVQATDIAPRSVYEDMDLFTRAFEGVRENYVVEPNDRKMIETALKGMLTGLDPHSDYMTAQEFRDMQQTTRGEFGGLGIEVMMENGFVKVVSSIDDTPAAKAGITANDLITEIDGESVQSLTLQQVVDKIRGPVNIKVKLTIARKGEDTPIEKTLTREIIRIQVVKSRVEGEFGYIRLTQFNEHSTDGIRSAVKDLTARIGPDKIKGFVFDLRNNPGGLLAQAITISDDFLESGVIVSTKGRTADSTRSWSADAGDIIGGKPLIVLINGGSASASEIVASALQDNHRATIIGTRSFGKASVQTIIPLGHGLGALRLTTARYYRPNGETLQAKGVMPEIEVLQDEPAELKGKTNTKGEASLKGHLKIEGQEETGSQAYVPPKPEDDKALRKALSLLRGADTDPAFPSKESADPK